MTAIFATIPQALAAAADLTLTSLGFGPGPHFSKPLRNGPAGPPTHYGLSHMANDDVFVAAVLAIPAVQSLTGPGGVRGFDQHILGVGLQMLPE